jgi:dTDP-4-dehydrorhamnose reductase
MPRLLHISGKKKYNWYEAAYLYYAYMGLDVSMVVPKTKWEIVSYAPRPKNAGLDVSLAKKLGVPVKSFEEGLKQWASQS